MVSPGIAIKFPRSSIEETTVHPFSNGGWSNKTFAFLSYLKNYLSLSRIKYFLVLLVKGKLGKLILYFKCNQEWIFQTGINRMAPWRQDFGLETEYQARAALPVSFLKNKIKN